MQSSGTIGRVRQKAPFFIDTAVDTFLHSINWLVSVAEA
jgi:hypothetical protein